MITEPCALCPGVSRESVLTFHHVRRGARLSLELAVCESCGGRLEKHLKRAVPKRLIEVEELEHVPL